MMSGVSNSTTARMIANILAMRARRRSNKQIKKPAKNWNQQNQAQKTSLNNPGTLVASPQPENNHQADNLAGNQQNPTCGAHTTPNGQELSHADGRMAPLAR